MFLCVSIHSFAWILSRIRDFYTLRIYCCLHLALECFSRCVSSQWLRSRYYIFCSCSFSTFSLSPRHFSSLTRSVTASNFSSFLQLNGDVSLCKYEFSKNALTFNWYLSDEWILKDWLLRVVFFLPLCQLYISATKTTFRLFRQIVFSTNRSCLSSHISTNKQQQKKRKMYSCTIKCLHDLLIHFEDYEHFAKKNIHTKALFVDSKFIIPKIELNWFNALGI